MEDISVVTLGRECQDPYSCLGDLLVDLPEMPTIDQAKKKFEAESEVAKMATSISLTNWVQRKCDWDPGEAPEYLVALYRLKCLADSLKQAHTERAVKNSEVIKLGTTIRLTSDMLTFTCQKHGAVVAPTNLLIAVLDSYQARYNVMCYTWLSDVMMKYLVPKFTQMASIDSDLVRMRREYGQDFFK